MPTIKKLLLKSAKCGTTRSISQRILRDDNFGLPGWSSHLGVFQVTGVLKCHINCGTCVSREGTCGCICNAHCGMWIFISKTYTFERKGYNAENDSFSTTLYRLYNRTNQNWPWNNGGTQYVITAQGLQTYSSQFIALCD